MATSGAVTWAQPMQVLRRTLVPS
ncbi:unnamed protein product, partial [Rotaria magnacalcarata]